MHELAELVRDIEGPIKKHKDKKTLQQQLKQIIMCANGECNHKQPCGYPCNIYNYIAKACQFYFENNIVRTPRNDDEYFKRVKYENTMILFMGKYDSGSILYGIPRDIIYEIHKYIKY